jgi:hypothetical protein
MEAEARGMKGTLRIFANASGAVLYWHTEGVDYGPRAKTTVALFRARPCQSARECQRLAGLLKTAMEQGNDPALPAA